MIDSPYSPTLPLVIRPFTPDAAMTTIICAIDLLLNTGIRCVHNGPWSEMYFYV